MSYTTHTTLASNLTVLLSRYDCKLLAMKFTTGTLMPADIIKNNYTY